MNILMLALAKFLPITVAFASEAAEVPFMNSVISWVAGVGGGIIAIFIIVSLVKDGIEFAKGQGSTSIWKILGKILFLFLILGLIFLTINYESIGKTAQGIGDKAINIVNNEATGIMP